MTDKIIGLCHEGAELCECGSLLYFYECGHRFCGACGRPLGKDPEIDIDRIARAIWTDRARRIKEQDVMSKYGFRSPGDTLYDELEPPMREGLQSEARAAIAEMQGSSDAK